MPRPVIDWEAMEPDWRAGLKSVLQLSKEYGVSRAAILKHWAKAGVDRDLAARIRARAEALVTQAEVTKEEAAERRATEKSIIEVNAQMQAQVILAHRSDVPRARIVMGKLLAELEGAIDAQDDLEQIANILRDGDQAMMAQLFDRLMSLPSRVDVGKKLVEALRTAVTLEREVFGINNDRTLGQTLDDFLDAISQS